MELLILVGSRKPYPRFQYLNSIMELLICADLDVCIGAIMLFKFHYGATNIIICAPYINLHCDLNSIMELLIYGWNDGHKEGWHWFKFHYGATNIFTTFKSVCAEPLFKFHYGATNIFKSNLQFIIGDWFKFHYGATNIICDVNSLWLQS